MLSSLRWPRLRGAFRLHLSSRAHQWGCLLEALRLAFRLAWLRLQSVIARRRLITITLVEHMGDILACEPVIRLLRQGNPRAYLVWICGKQYAELLRWHPALDAVWTVPCLTSWIWVRRLHLAHQQYDLHFNGRVCPICQIPFKNLSGDSNINPDNYYFRGSILGSFCLVAGLPPLDDTPELHIPREVQRTVDALGLPPAFVALHCRSNDASRDWSPQNWARLARHLEERYQLPVVELGIESVLAGDGLRTVINLCGKTSPLASAAVVSRATLFIGVDSSCAHFANASHVPGVILIGRYQNFTRHVPYSGFYAHGGAILVRASGPVAGLAVTEVIEAVGARLACPSPAS
jgi:ADP-heptose:LPS heptosyltransferase